MSGRYKAYPKYQDSGITWTGKIPSHWGAKQLKFLCSYNDDVLPESAGADFEIEYIDIGSVDASSGIKKTEKFTLKKAPSRARRRVQDGDVIISTVRTYLEAIASINNPPENMVVSTGFAVIRPREGLDKGFAAYCLRAEGFIGEVVSRSVGISYPAINASDLVNIGVPVLPLPEQKQIAKFLDHETGKIDLLIEKQQALIALLKEKRQAVVSHAVTKGLNPHAKMKDSGVEWLGEVPEHWEVSRIKFTITTFEQGWSPQCDARPRDRNEIGVLKVGCVNSGVFESNENKALPSSLMPRHQYSLKKGDLLISRANTRDLVGKAAMVEEDDAMLLLCDKLYRLRFSFQTEPHFIRDYILSDAGRNQIELDATGASASMVNIGQDCIKEMPIAFPPLSEQQEITRTMRKHAVDFESLLEKSEKQIELMQERRTALISVAVTGKIDVRDWEPAPALTERK